MKKKGTVLKPSQRTRTRSRAFCLHARLTIASSTFRCSIYLFSLLSTWEQRAGCICNILDARTPGNHKSNENKIVLNKSKRTYLVMSASNTRYRPKELRNVGQLTRQLVEKEKKYSRVFFFFLILPSSRGTNGPNLGVHAHCTLYHAMEKTLCS